MRPGVTCVKVLCCILARCLHVLNTRHSLPVINASGVGAGRSWTSLRVKTLIGCPRSTLTLLTTPLACVCLVKFKPLFFWNCSVFYFFFYSMFFARLVILSEPILAALLNGFKRGKSAKDHLFWGQVPPPSLSSQREPLPPAPPFSHRPTPNPPNRSGLVFSWLFTSVPCMNAEPTRALLTSYVCALI